MTVVLFLAIGTLIGIAIGAIDSGTARRRDGAAEFSPTGQSIELDCRACGKFNRVPRDRVLDRPKCGRCKARLLPRSRLVLCSTRPMEQDLRDKLDSADGDPDAFWRRIADHVPQPQSQANDTVN